MPPKEELPTLPTRVRIFWDIENVAIPPGGSVVHMYEQILQWLREDVKAMDHNCEVSTKVYFVDARDERFRMTESQKARLRFLQCELISCTARKEDADRNIAASIDEMVSSFGAKGYSVVVVSSDQGFNDVYRKLTKLGIPTYVVHQAIPESDHEKTLRMFVTGHKYIDHPGNHVTHINIDGQTIPVRALVENHALTAFRMGKPFGEPKWCQGHADHIKPDTCRSFHLHPDFVGYFSTVSSQELGLMQQQDPPSTRSPQQQASNAMDTTASRGGTATTPTMTPPPPQFAEATEGTAVHSEGPATPLRAAKGEFTFSLESFSGPIPEFVTVDNATVPLSSLVVNRAVKFLLEKPHASGRKCVGHKANVTPETCRFVHFKADLPSSLSPSAATPSDKPAQATTTPKRTASASPNLSNGSPSPSPPRPDQQTVVTVTVRPNDNGEGASATATIAICVKGQPFPMDLLADTPAKAALEAAAQEKASVVRSETTMEAHLCDGKCRRGPERCALLHSLDLLVESRWVPAHFVRLNAAAVRLARDHDLVGRWCPGHPSSVTFEQCAMVHRLF